MDNFFPCFELFIYKFYNFLAVFQFQIQYFLSQLLTTNVFRAKSYLEQLRNFYGSSANLYIIQIFSSLDALSKQIQMPAETQNILKDEVERFILNFKKSLINLCDVLCFRKKFVFAHKNKLAKFSRVTREPKVLVYTILPNISTVRTLRSIPGF